MTLNPDTIWSKVYIALATNSSTKITDPNGSRNDPTLAIFSSFPDYSSTQRYPIFIIKEPVLNEMGYAMNSATRVVRGPIRVEVYALSSADLKNAMNVIKAGIRGAKNYLEGQGVKLPFSPEESMFEDEESDSWLEGNKKVHIQVTKFIVKSTGTS